MLNCPKQNFLHQNFSMPNVFHEAHFVMYYIHIMQEKTETGDNKCFCNIELCRVLSFFLI